MTPPPAPARRPAPPVLLSLALAAACGAAACGGDPAAGPRPPAAPALARDADGLQQPPLQPRRALPRLGSAHTLRREAGSRLDGIRYNITYRFLTPVGPAERRAFERAAARWEQVIVGDLAPVTGTIPADFCDAGLPEFQGTIDDLLIDVRLENIDGPGNILGAAGPCLVRGATDRLPFYGVLLFDTADLAELERDGQVEAVVLHEVGHVLGIGTLWQDQGLLVGTTADPRFAGRRANATYRALGGRDGLVPVEALGGPGTAFSHWRKTVFGNELMTGTLSPPPNPLSVVTAGSIRDLGYRAVLAADFYQLPQPQPAAALVAAAGGAAAGAGGGAQPGELPIGRRERLITPRAEVGDAP